MFCNDDECHVCISAINFWETLEQDASMTKITTADAKVKVQWPTAEDPLPCWFNHKHAYSNLFKLAKTFQCVSIFRTMWKDILQVRRTSKRKEKLVQILSEK